MKLLFDQNISFRIIRVLSDHFSDAKQVRELELENCTDLEIWDFARDNDYSIVTFDSDFYDLSVIKGIPPKIIWLRIGNTSTENIAKVLMDNCELISEFIHSPRHTDISCLEID
ncbi:MAG: DUF5615 family PIN-like protein [Methanosarcinaceae archaeon]